MGPTFIGTCDPTGERKMDMNSAKEQVRGAELAEGQVRDGFWNTV